MANWKAAGPNLVQGYWFTKLTGIHTRLQEHLQHCVWQGNVPEWIGIRGTVMIQKDPSKGNQTSKHRPYCLPTQDKDAFDGDHGRDVISTSGEEWTACR